MVTINLWTQTYTQYTYSCGDVEYSLLPYFSFISDVDAYVEYINPSTLIPKLNEQGLPPFEEGNCITNATLKPRERILNMLQCVTKMENGWKMFLAALKADTSHSGHATLLQLLKVLPPIEGM